jgi:hypothetical protein
VSGHESPSGRRWTVRRRWAPRLRGASPWRRFRRQYRRAFDRVGDVADADPGCLEVFGEGLLVGLAIILGVLFLVFVAIPLVFAVLDLLVVLLLTAGGIVVRVLFRRPWTIEATSADGGVLRWQVKGWRASGARRDEIAGLLAAGIVPPDAQHVAGH